MWARLRALGGGAAKFITRTLKNMATEKQESDAQESQVVTVDQVANLIAQMPVEVKAALFLGCFGRANRLVQHLVGQQGKKSRAGKGKKKR